MSGHSDDFENDWDGPGGPDDNLPSDVSDILTMMSRTGYPCDRGEQVSELHGPIGALPNEYGMSLLHWLTSMPTIRRLRIMMNLSGEVELLDQARSRHPSSQHRGPFAGTERQEPTELVEAVPWWEGRTPPPPPPPPIEVPAWATKPPRDESDADAVAEIDSMITDMSARTLVPTSEFIDRLLDLRNAIDREAGR